MMWWEKRNCRDHQLSRTLNLMNNENVEHTRLVEHRASYGMSHIFTVIDLCCVRLLLKLCRYCWSLRRVDIASCEYFFLVPLHIDVRLCPEMPVAVQMHQVSYSLPVLTGTTPAVTRGTLLWPLYGMQFWHVYTTSVGDGVVACSPDEVPVPS